MNQQDETFFWGRFIKLVKAAYEHFVISMTAKEAVSKMADEAKKSLDAAYRLSDDDPTRGEAIAAGRELRSAAFSGKAEAEKSRALAQKCQKEAAKEMQSVIADALHTDSALQDAERGACNGALGTLQAAVAGGSLPPGGLKTAELVTRQAGYPRLAGNIAKTMAVFAMIATRESDLAAVFPGWSAGYYRGVRGLLGALRDLDWKIKVTDQRVQDLRKQDPREELLAAERRLKELQRAASVKDAVLAELRVSVPETWFAEGPRKQGASEASAPILLHPATEVIQMETSVAKDAERDARKGKRDAEKAAKAAKRTNVREA